MAHKGKEAALRHVEVQDHTIYGLVSVDMKPRRPGFRFEYQIVKWRISQGIGPMLPLPFLVVDKENRGNLMSVFASLAHNLRFL
jgi:hypothetical protein